MPANAKSKWILSKIGDPARIAGDLRQYRKAAKVLSSDHPRLVEKHARRWVVVYEGAVKAEDRSLDGVLEKAASLNLPKDKIIVRYIDRNRKTMILPSVC